MRQGKVRYENMKTMKCLFAGSVFGLFGIACCPFTQNAAASPEVISTNATYVTYGSITPLAAADGDASTTAPSDRENDSNPFNQCPLYRQHELDVDLFGMGSIGEETLDHPSTDRFRHHGLWGGGGGVTGYFCRYIGVGGEYDALTRDSRFSDSASGNVFVRLPILNTGLAPYIFGGGGYEFEGVEQSFGQVGGGLEFRFSTHFGIFTDGRYVIANRSEDFAQVRAGLRIAF